MKPRRNAQAGFSLLELTLTLVVMGLVGALIAGAYGRSGSAVDRGKAQASVTTLRQAVLAFTLANRRLPCPDGVGTGWEGDAAGTCAAGLNLGFVPYLSLGLSQPSDPQRGLLGVYRSAVVDLAVPTERSGDSAASPTFQGLGDLLRGLTLAAAQPVSTGLPYLTGNNAQQGAVACAARVLSNPAFVIVLPVADRVGNGNPFEGPHAGLLTGQRCVVSPGRASDFDFDDVVVAESLHTLMGWLAPYNY